MNNRISRGLRNFALLAGLGLLMPLAAKAAALATFTANNQTITALAGDTVTGSYTVGGTGFNNDALQITGGVTVSQPGNSNGFVVGVAGHTGNSLLVSGSGSTLNSVNNFFDVNAGSSVTVSSGGNMTAGGFGTTFSAAGASTITITGTGSTWNAGGINLNAASGSLSVLAGGTVTTGSTSTLIIGNTYNLNTVTVSGAGSVFTQKAQVKVGTTGASSNNNALMIGTGGTMNVTDLGNTGLGIIVNGTGSNTGNKVQIDGGTLNVVSAGSSTPAINITKGALILNSGNVTTEVLLANTDATSVVTFNGGTLTTSSTTIANSAVFTVGNGTSAAALVLNGGTHSFANGLAISNNATLSGTGTVTATGNLNYQGSSSTFNGAISGSGNTLALNNAAAVLTLGGTNTYTGTTLVSAGTLLVSGSLANTSGVTVSSTGTLQLGAANAINSGASLTLSGGTFNLNGYSESLSGGTLTTTASSSLDFASGTPTLLFSSLAAYTGTLAITHWTFGSTHLGFTSNVGLSASAFTVNGQAAAILDNHSITGYYEVVPEPATWALLAFSLTTVMVLRRRRLHS